ncbi:MAG: hypothetical protein RSA40_01610 [Malacoplasma sp.]
MSVVNKIIFIGSIVFLYKTLSSEDKIKIKEIVKTKVMKYKGKIIEVIDLLDLYSKDPKGIREESIDYHEKLTLLMKSIDEIDDDQLLDDIDDIFNFKSDKKNTKKIVAKKK